MKHLYQHQGNVTTTTPAHVQQTSRNLAPQDAWRLLEGSMRQVTSTQFERGVIEVALVVGGQLQWLESVIVERGEAHAAALLTRLQSGLPRGAHLCLLAVSGGEVQA